MVFGQERFAMGMSLTPNQGSPGSAYVHSHTFCSLSHWLSLPSQASWQVYLKPFRSGVYWIIILPCNTALRINILTWPKPKGKFLANNGGCAMRKGNQIRDQGWGIQLPPSLWLPPLPRMVPLGAFVSTVSNPFLLRSNANKAQGIPSENFKSIIIIYQSPKGIQTLPTMRVYWRAQLWQQFLLKSAILRSKKGFLKKT